MNAFQDGTGATSSMRVVMLLWIALLIGANIFSLVTKGALCSCRQILQLTD
jgi:hypothetical protein